MNGALSMVGRIDVPDGIERHPHMIEAWALATVMGKNEAERVVGTSNGPNEAGKHVELYGWGRNVGEHVDRTGWIYFAPLRFKGSIVFAEGASVLLERGAVYRLNDFETHGTYDDSPVVCAFVGPFPEPDEPEEKVRRLAEAVAKLKPGVGGREAPRVSVGFRVPLKGEVWAMAGDHAAELVLLEDARKNGWVIATCANCQGHAVKVDRSFPWCWENNRCGKCLMSESKAA